MEGFPDASSKKIYFLYDANGADLVVYFTTNQSAAGWKNTSKQSLLN